MQTDEENIGKNTEGKQETRCLSEFTSFLYFLSTEFLMCLYF